MNKPLKTQCHPDNSRPQNGPRTVDKIANGGIAAMAFGAAAIWAGTMLGTDTALGGIIFALGV